MVQPKNSTVGSGRAPPMSPTATGPLVTLAQDASTSYDKQASDIIANYKTKAAKHLFELMANDVKKDCKRLLKEIELHGVRSDAIKGVVTSRLKGDESLETKLTSADGKRFFLKWLEKSDANGKKHDRLLENPDMGDLAAVRIGLYLPGDVITVARRIKEGLTVKHPFGTVMDPTRKAAMVGNQDFTRHDQGRFGEGDDPGDDTWEHYGYKSWQVVVEWKGNLPKKNKDLNSIAELFSPLKVEIQVGTVVTQAWAEVQHNIIYKQPKDIQVTQTKKRMVDATNGMAITTDIILRELERSHSEARAETEARRQRDRDQPFLSLWEYCMDDDGKGAKSLIDSGFDLSTQMENGSTALHMPSRYAASKVAVALLASLNEESAARIVMIRNNEGNTALHTASRYSDSSVAIALLASLNEESAARILMIQNNDGNTALHAASVYSAGEVAVALLDSLNEETAARILMIQNNDGNTALHTASIYGAGEVAVALLDSLDKEAAARIVRIKNKKESTALLVTTMNSEVNIEGLNLTTSFDLAAIVRALLPHCDKDMIIEDKKDGYTAFEWACHGGCVGVIREFVSALSKTDLMIRYSPRIAPAFHNAARKGREDIVKELLCGIDVDFQNHASDTALHCACRSGHTSVVEELLRHGADITILNLFRETAYDAAKKEGYTTIMALLEVHYSRNKVNVRPLSGSPS